MGFGIIDRFISVMKQVDDICIWVFWCMGGNPQGNSYSAVLVLSHLMRTFPKGRENSLAHLDCCRWPDVRRYH